MWGDVLGTHLWNFFPSVFRFDGCSAGSALDRCQAGATQRGGEGAGTRGRGRCYPWHVAAIDL